MLLEFVIQGRPRRDILPRKFLPSQVWPLQTTLYGRRRYVRVTFAMRMVGREGSKSVSWMRSIKEGGISVTLCRAV